LAPPGDLLDPLHHVFRVVVDDVRGAVRLGQLRLLFGPHGADQVRADRARPLTCDQADAAGRRVEQHGLARLEPPGLAEQVLHGQALQQHRGAGLEGDGVRQVHQVLGRHQAQRAVGAVRARRVGHAVAHLHMGDALADRFDHARPFLPQAARQFESDTGRCGNKCRCN
jgi:hypothetical protein